jgi:sugar lactone lactonase YvrE
MIPTRERLQKEIFTQIEGNNDTSHMMNCLLLVLLVIGVATIYGAPPPPSSSVIQTVASFNRIEFNFPSPQLEQEYIQNKHYINCTIAGIKLDSRNNIYVSIPRWKHNVPITLARLNTTTNKFDPFPSYEWNSNTNNVTHGLQSVLGFEIDSMDRMWILDQGKMYGDEAQKGSIKLIIYDLRKNQVVYQYHFTEEEAPLKNSFLNDIVVSTADNVAYISDSGISMDPDIPMSPAIIYFDIGDEIVKRMLVDTPPTQANVNVTFSVNGKECLGRGNPMRTGADGIALTCDGQRLYWTPLTSRTLYAIDTDVLQMYDEDDKIVVNAVIDLGEKISTSDGLACTSRQNLLITALETDSIYQVSEKTLEPYVSQSEFEKRTKVLPRDKLANMLTEVANNSMIQQNTKMLWPDTIAIGNDNYMYFVSNNLCAFLTDDIDFESGPNFFIYRVYTADKSRSYVYGCEYEKTQLRAIEWILIIAGGVTYVTALTALLIYTVRNTRIQLKKEEEELYSR